MRLFALAVFLISITSPSLAEYLTLECEIKQHIILREHEPVDGMMGTFIMHERNKDITFSRGGYFDGGTFDIQFSTPDYLKAAGDYGQTFIYREGKFHFSFISYMHVTSMSGQCKHVPRVIEG